MKQKKKKRKKEIREEKKEINNKLTKDRIFIDIRKTFEQQEEVYYKPNRDIIIDFQNSDTWKIQVTIAINFISSKDFEEECVMHSMSDNIKRTSYKDT